MADVEYGWGEIFANAEHGARDIRPNLKPEKENAPASIENKQRGCP